MVIYKPLNEPDSLHHLQNDINIVYDWCNRNKLTINIEKTKAHIFPRNSNIDLQLLHQNNPKTINNTQLQYEHTFQYLGINIDQHLTMKSMCDSRFMPAINSIFKARQRFADYVYAKKKKKKMSAAIQVLRAMFVSVVDYRNVFLTGVNRNSL